VRSTESAGEVDCLGGSNDVSQPPLTVKVYGRFAYQRPLSSASDNPLIHHKEVIMRGKDIIYVSVAVVLLVLAFGVGRLSAAQPLAPSGGLDSPGPPESTYSYTLEDIYDRLDAGAAGSQTAFTEPTSGPTAGTGHTLNEIMALAPAEDNTDGVLPAQVLTGETYWSLRTDGTWGTQTGTMPNRGQVIYTPGTSNQTVAAGYHNGSGYVVGDADLVAGNIRSGANIFGVTGDSNVVDTSSGDAAVGDIVSGKKAWVDGVELTGTGVNLSDPAPVPKTGQTASYATGDDGDLENGVAWPTPRFTDNGNGTVTDNLTGLIWLKNANCFGQRTWTTALSDANSLENGSCGLTDGSSAGDWRLPNVRELQSLVDYGLDDPCLPSGHPFTVVQSNAYWSSTTYASSTTQAWGVGMHYGFLYANGKTGGYYVWPVRGG
jgi:hypothetical protein